MSLFDIFKKPPKASRPCPSCGTDMPHTATSEGNVWECPQCHSQITEIGDPCCMSMTTGPRDLITDEQVQLFVALGEKIIPRFKDEATQRLKEVVDPFDSWLFSCFSGRRFLESSDRRKLQAALYNRGWMNRLPKYADAFTDEQRLEYLQFVKETLGADLFQKLRPKDFNKYAEALGLPPRKQKEKEVRFTCPQCGQTYAAPEQMAGNPLACQGCNESLHIPRPATGYYAAPTESELEEATLYRVSVREGMHRGELKAELARAHLDPSRTPTPAMYEQQAQTKFARALKEVDDEIEIIQRELSVTDLTPEKIKELRDALEWSLDGKQEILDEEKERKKELEREARDDAREAAESRQFYESGFARGGDWSEFYRKPTRKQFDAVFSWLDQNKPGWVGFSALIDAVDFLFPELKK